MSLWEFIEKLTRENRWRTIGALFALATLSLIIVSGVVAFIAHYLWPGGIEIIPSAGSIKLLQKPPIQDAIGASIRMAKHRCRI